MTNPNNCSTCEYNHITTHDGSPDEHCYMFKDEPTGVCAQHTLRLDLAKGMGELVDVFLRFGYCGRIK